MDDEAYKRAISPNLVTEVSWISAAAAAIWYFELSAPAGIGLLVAAAIYRAITETQRELVRLNWQVSNVRFYLGDMSRRMESVSEKLHAVEVHTRRDAIGKPFPGDDEF